MKETTIQISGNMKTTGRRRISKARSEAMDRTREFMDQRHDRVFRGKKQEDWSFQENINANNYEDEMWSPNEKLFYEASKEDISRSERRSNIFYSFILVVIGVVLGVLLE